MSQLQFRATRAIMPLMNGAFGPVRQIGYVVADLGRATSFWLQVLGVGPFFQLEAYAVANCDFRGARSTPLLNVAIGYSGPLQIELIQPLGEQNTLYAELQRTSPASPHYTTHWVDDLSSAIARANELGCEVVQSGGVAEAGRFVYLRGPSGILFELLETNDAIRGWFGAMEQAAAGWDGQRPLRPAFG
ncbi:MAG TPA: VOC family protein [Lacunisphaera sp.]|nr:VOC family protein [Lacunisphaera sp.]